MTISGIAEQSSSTGGEVLECPANFSAIPVLALSVADCCLHCHFVLQSLMHSWATVPPWSPLPPPASAGMPVMHSLRAWATGCLPAVPTAGSAG
jgi:hypothetical protein